MDVDEIKGLISELPDLTVSKKKYYPGELFFNEYGGNNPLRVGCRYSDQSVAEGNASEEFIFLIEIFGGEQNLDECESETYEGREIFYGHVPTFPAVKRFIEEEERDFLSWSKGNRIYTLVDLTRDERQVKSFSELPGLKSYFDSRLNKRLKRFLASVEGSKRALKSPFLHYAGHLPPKVKGWSLVTFFVYTEAVNFNGQIFLIPSIRGNYRHKKSEEYVNLKLAFGFSFLPTTITRYLKPRQGRMKSQIEGKEVYIRENRILSYYNREERYSAEVSGDNENRYNVMKDIMSKALQGLKGYSCIEASMKFVKNVGDIYLKNKNLNR